MPPRFAYWTIIVEGKPTAFRAQDRDELVPTFKQLQGKHPDAVMMWFARGRLWSSPEEARAADRGAGSRAAEAGLAAGRGTSRSARAIRHSSRREAAAFRRTDAARARKRVRTDTCDRPPDSGRQGKPDRRPPPGEVPGCAREDRGGAPAAVRTRTGATGHGVPETGLEIQAARISRRPASLRESRVIAAIGPGRTRSPAGSRSRPEIAATAAPSRIAPIGRRARTGGPARRARRGTAAIGHGSPGSRTGSRSLPEVVATGARFENRGDRPPREDRRHPAAASGRDPGARGRGVPKKPDWKPKPPGERGPKPGAAVRAVHPDSARVVHGGPGGRGPGGRGPGGKPPGRGGRGGGSR